MGGRRTKGQRHARSARAWLCALLIACSAAVAVPACIFGGQTGQNADSKGQEHCDGGRRPIADGERVSSLGLSPEQAAERIGGRRTLELAWVERGRRVQATLTVTYGGNAATLVQDDGCVERLELEVVLELRSEDGELAEKLPATLSVISASSAQLTAELAIGDVQGSYDLADDGLGALRDPVLEIAADFDPTGVSGSVAARDLAPGADAASQVVANFRQLD